MSRAFRGADLLAAALASAGVKAIFTLSGNHIMPVFDALLDTKIDLIHVRHEAAAVHMADAFARLTGEIGVALVTGGQGHTNAVAALTTAQCAEAPILLLSGHAGLKELGRGAFQELAQVELARPVTKASWLVRSAARLGHDIAEAIRIAKSGRPGPVHLSLPVDLLEALLPDAPSLWPSPAALAIDAQHLSTAAAENIATALARAKCPLILAGPVLCTPHGRVVLAELQVASGIPVLGMESPRGINDPSLGAFADILREADLIVLLGKPHDFTIRFGAPPFVSQKAQFIVLDPEADLIERAKREQGERVILSAVSDARSAAICLTTVLGEKLHPSHAWRDEVLAATSYRPQHWRTIRGKHGAVHPIELCRAVQAVIDRDPNTIFIADGGEIGQWVQSGVIARRRVINGVAGSIGAALPFAAAARVVEPNAPIVAVMGDGTFGFHMAELDTAVRHGLPYVAVVGNDATWGAEHQIQLRDYGKERTHSCSLLPTRYDQVATALGGHGEYVTDGDALGSAIERAIASGKPACVNVMIEGLAAPQIRRAT